MVSCSLCFGKLSMKSFFAVFDYPLHIRLYLIVDF